MLILYPPCVFFLRSKKGMKESKMDLPTNPWVPKGPFEEVGINSFRDECI